MTILHLHAGGPSYFIPLLKSPTFYHGREIGATQNHGWSTLRDLAAKIRFYVES